MIRRTVSRSARWAWRHVCAWRCAGPVTRLSRRLAPQVAAAVARGWDDTACQIIALAALRALELSPRWAIEGSHPDPRFAGVDGHDPWTRVAALTIVWTVRRAGVDTIAPVGLWLPRADERDDLVVFLDVGRPAAGRGDPPRTVRVTMPFKDPTIPRDIISWRREHAPPGQDLRQSRRARS